MTREPDRLKGNVRKKKKEEGCRATRGGRKEVGGGKEVWRGREGGTPGAIKCDADNSSDVADDSVCEHVGLHALRRFAVDGKNNVAQRNAAINEGRA